MRAKLRDEIATILFDELIIDATRQEQDDLEILLNDLVVAIPELKDKRNTIEGAATSYATALAEAAFLAGLTAGGDLRSLICK
jgi:hypothetical protein